jgi:adenylate cyclase
MTATDQNRALGPGRAIYDDALGRNIIAIHRWVVDQGLRGTRTAAVFDGLCRRLAEAGVPLWRGFAGVQTLHPQWGGWSLTWERTRDQVVPQRRARGADYDRDLQESPFALLMSGGAIPPQSGLGWPSLRRRLSGPEAQLDFPVLEGLAAAGATDYFAQIARFGPPGDPSYGNGTGYSFATDRPGGFIDDDLRLIEAVLPAASLAIMSDAGHGIASGLLAAYLGEDAGRRVHAGAVQRGSVESIRAALCYADIRGFTAIADALPGLVLVELLDEVFETVIAPLRARGGQVLKFLGDGILASFPFEESERCATCRRALDAAVEAMAGLDRLGASRRDAGKPAASVDFALHVGEVLYGNVGAVDRLDFTVIGPAVNEVARIEVLCEPLGRNLLVSAEFASAAGDSDRLCPLGRHVLRGVREPQEIYGFEPRA